MTLQGSQQQSLRHETENGPLPQQTLSICTIISKNYLSYARVLAKSFRKYHRGKVFVLLTDRVDGYFDPKDEPFTLVDVGAIAGQIPNFTGFSFQYAPLEFNTAVKPFFLEYLFEKYGMKKLAFFDPDILITNSLRKIDQLLEKYSVVLTPHITKPFNDLDKPNELEILRSGAYNLGFIGLSDDANTRNLLKWWRERLLRFCKSDPEKGYFVDQKWFELVPGYFENVFILREDTFNVAYWNLHYRRTSFRDGKVFVNEKPAHFIHFSGLDPGKKKSISVHQDRFAWRDKEIPKDLLNGYRELLIADGYRTTRLWPCVFNYFNNGVPIPAAARHLYWKLDDQEKKAFNNPFDVSEKKSFYHWLREKYDPGEPFITRLMMGVYEQMAEVQVLHPDVLQGDREMFVHWFYLNAKGKLQIDEKLLEFPGGSRDRRARKGHQLVLGFALWFRPFVKKILKKLVRNNLAMINRLKLFERRIQRMGRKPADFSERGKKPSFSLGLKQGVNICGYFQAELGVGEGARASARSLREADVPIGLINNKTHSFSRQEDGSFTHFLSSNPYAINLVHVNADMFGRFYREEGKVFFENRYNIGYWVWELAEFPDEWTASFRHVDEVWVPSRFVQEAVVEKAFQPVLAMPHAVEAGPLYPHLGKEDFGLDENCFTFLFVFDFLSYFERKNPLALIDAFKKAFKPNEPVRLFLKCANASNNRAGFEAMKKAAANYPILIREGYMDRQMLNTLMSLVDCYASLHRSEGFGLTMAEAMAFGKPVIATRYSGNTDYMDVSNSFLVDYQLVPIERPVGPYKKGCVWADPDVAHAAFLMRKVYENAGLAKDIGAQAKRDIEENLGYRKIGTRMKARIQNIERRCRRDG